MADVSSQTPTANNSAGSAARMNMLLLANILTKYCNISFLFAALCRIFSYF